MAGPEKACHLAWGWVSCTPNPNALSRGVLQTPPPLTRIEVPFRWVSPEIQNIWFMIKLLCRLPPATIYGLSKNDGNRRPTSAFFGRGITGGSCSTHLGGGRIAMEEYLGPMWAGCSIYVSPALIKWKGQQSALRAADVKLLILFRHSTLIECGFLAPNAARWLVRGQCLIWWATTRKQL